MHDDEDLTLKVYSPDIEPFSLEGELGLFNSISSIFVGPIRLLIHIPHNIMILPANLLEEYAMGLLIVGSILLLLGIFDYLLFKKWVLFASQIPVIFVALSFKKKASFAVEKNNTPREVDIDYAEVKDVCMTVYDEIDSALGKGE